MENEFSLSKRFLNSLEPPEVIRHFLHHPPEGFEPVVSAAGQPGFWTKFDLLTTADAGLVRIVNESPIGSWVRRMLTWRTLFWGTTVTEYLPVPFDSEAARLVESILAGWKASSRVLVLKDLPAQSPLLSASEQIAAAQFIEACKKAGFILMAGQALSYVPIDFESEEEYLSRLSPARRKDIRRKMRSRADLHIELVKTGCERLNNRELLNELYGLYLNVYRQSDIHFDKLTFEFFSAIFKDPSLDGHLFLYYAAKQLIGFNFCFVYRGMLVDKYIGLRYPQAREYNVYFISWMENLAFALSHKLTHYITGWTDLKIKAYLGAQFIFTQHAVYMRSRVFRYLLRKVAHHFEHDRAWLEEHRP